MAIVDKTCAFTEWQTPEHILEAVRSYFGGRIDLDPATSPDNPTKARYFFTAPHPLSDEVGGLKRSWFDCVFVNPPYGKVLKDWAAKIHEEAACGRRIVALLPGQRFETVYWQEHILTCDLTSICFIRGRLQFINPITKKPAGSHPYGSMLYIYNGEVRRDYRHFNHLGKVMEVRL